MGQSQYIGRFKHGFAKIATFAGKDEIAPLTEPLGKCGHYLKKLTLFNHL
jgi:hypothetical protein